MPVDQNITGSSGITSGELFGDPRQASLYDQQIKGSAGIQSAEAFGKTEGFSQQFSIHTIPMARYGAY